MFGTRFGGMTGKKVRENCLARLLLHLRDGLGLYNFCVSAKNK
jgi:hypothetical protein